MTAPLHNNDDPDSLRGLNVGEAALLRREFDRDTRERLRTIEARQEQFEHTMNNRMVEIMTELHRISERQKEQGPMLDALNTVVNSGMAIKWLMVGVVGLLAALATALTAVEALKKWW